MKKQIKQHRTYKNELESLNEDFENFTFSKDDDPMQVIYDDYCNTNSFNLTHNNMCFLVAIRDSKWNKKSGLTLLEVMKCVYPSARAPRGTSLE